MVHAGRGEQRIAHGPVVERTHPAAGRPLADAPCPVSRFIAAAGKRVTIRRRADFAVHTLRDLRACPRQGLRGLGQSFFVLVVDVHGSQPQQHRGNRWVSPGEVRVAQETVVDLQRAQVVSPRVAVALRVTLGCRVFVDRHSVRALDVVVDGVSDFARIDAFGEVPHKAVVVRGVGYTRRQFGHPPSTEQSEFFVQERRNLVVEAEKRRGKRAVVDGEDTGAVDHDVRSEPDGRVECVGHGLVAQQHVQGIQPSGGEQELLIGRGGVDAEIQAQALGGVEDGVVDLDQSGVFGGLHVERYVTFVGLSGLLEHARLHLHRVLIQVPHALLERRHGIQHALDPSFGEIELRVVAPARADDLRHNGVGVRNAVANGEEAVDHVQQRSALSAYPQARQARFLVIYRCGSRVRRRRPVRSRFFGAPLEFEVVRPAREALAEEHVHLLRQQVDGILQRDHPARVQPRLDLDDGQRDRVAGADAQRGIARVVEGERYVSRTAADSGHGQVVERGIGRDRDDARCEAVDRGVPFLLPARVGNLAETLDLVALRCREAIDEQELTPRWRGDTLADEAEVVRSLRRIVVEPFTQVGRQVVEVGASLANGDVAVRRRFEAVRCQLVVEVRAARDGGVEQQHRGTLSVVRGLLVDDVHAELPPDFRQAVCRLCEGLPHIHGRHVLGPGDGPGRVHGGAGRRQARIAAPGQPGDGGVQVGPAVGLKRGERESVLHRVVVVHHNLCGSRVAGACAASPPGVGAVLPGGAADGGGIGQVRECVERVRSS